MALPTRVAQQGEAADKAFNPQQATSAEPTVQPAAASDTVNDSFEHKYKTLQGVLRKEQEENRQTVQFMHQQIMNLTNQVNQLSQAQQQAAPVQTVNPGDVFTADEKQTFEDEGLSEAVMKVMAGAVQRVAGAATQPLSDQVIRMEQNTVKSREDTFFERLETSVPDWEQINNDPAFLQYLSTPIPGTRFTLRDALTVGRNDLDAKGVIEIFTEFKRKAGLTAKPNPQPQPEPIVPVNPGRVVTAGSDKIWSKAEVRQFYKDVATGRIPADQAAQMEAEIVQAHFEGRAEGSTEGFQFKQAADSMQAPNAPAGGR